MANILAVALFASYSILLVTEELDAILSGPETAVASVGKTKVLSCSSSEPQHWTWRFDEGEVVSARVCMLKKVDLGNRYSLETTDKHVCNLVIKNASLNDAGKYLCSDTEHLTSQVSAQLVVIDKLECSHHVSTNSPLTITDSITIRCSINYVDPTISNSPILKWVGTSEEPVVHRGPTSMIVEITKPLKEFTNEINPLFPSFKCLLSFDQLDIPTGYNESCATQVLPVHYPPQDVKIMTPSGDSTVKEGDNIFCMSHSNPSSVFKWSFLDANGAVNKTDDGGRCNETDEIESTTTQRLKVYRTGLYGCTASNYVNGKLYNLSASANIFIVKPLGTTSIVMITSFTTLVMVAFIYMMIFCSCADWRSVIVV